MLEVFLDSLLDSLKIIVIVFLFYFLLSFFEAKLSSLLEKNKKVSPFLGALFGLIPQCGFSVVASDLYLKRHITIGTIVAIFIACNDEALPILLSNINKLPLALCLILTKFIIAFIVGFILDAILSRNKLDVVHHHEHCSHEKEIKTGCCHHQINNENENPWHAHLFHPLIHSLKIFIYVFCITFAFGMLFYFIGEENIINFLSQNKYLSPLLTTLIGLIPNCASSVVIADLFLLDAIPFGACLSGLMVNAGLGTFILLKDKEHRKETILIFAILIIVSLLSGYLFVLFM